MSEILDRLTFTRVLEGHLQEENRKIICVILPTVEKTNFMLQYTVVSKFQRITYRDEPYSDCIILLVT